MLEVENVKIGINPTWIWQGVYPCQFEEPIKTASGEYFHTGYYTWDSILNGFSTEAKEMFNQQFEIVGFEYATREEGDNDDIIFLVLKYPYLSIHSKP